MAQLTSSRRQALQIYKKILRIIPRTFSNDLEMQSRGRTAIRDYYENRRHEMDTQITQQHIEEGLGAITVLTEGIMQVEVTEYDKYGNPVSGVANVRPEHTKPMPDSNTLSARDLAQMRKENKQKQKEEL